MAGIFDILGPVMVGPSSSHTAGAVRIGLMARQLFGRQPDHALVWLHGSFASTGKGHGTAKALIAGLLGMQPDDLRIPISYDIAKESGMDFKVVKRNFRGAHPNTAQITMESDDGNQLTVQACSVGGGRIRVRELDGMKVDFGGDAHTLIVKSIDQPGIINIVTWILSRNDINIASIQAFREKRGGVSLSVIEIDNPVPDDVLKGMEEERGILSVKFLNALDDIKSPEGGD